MIEESLVGSCSFRSSGSKESSASSDTGSGEGVGIPGEVSRLGSGVVVVEMVGAAVMRGWTGVGSGEGLKRRINVHSRSSSVSIVCAARVRAPSAKGSLTWPLELLIFQRIRYGRRGRRAAAIRVHQPQALESSGSGLTAWGFGPRVAS